jgi:hypothetical protein
LIPVVEGRQGVVCDVRVEILGNPDAIFLSSSPGDIRHLAVATMHEKRRDASAIPVQMTVSASPKFVSLVPTASR